MSCVRRGRSRAQGDYTIWARLLGVMRVPNAGMSAQVVENIALREQLAWPCPHCGKVRE